MTGGAMYLVDPHPTLETGIRGMLAGASGRLRVSRVVPTSGIESTHDQVVFAVEDIAGDVLRRWSDLIDHGPMEESFEDWASEVYQPGYRETIETIESRFHPSRTKIVVSSSFPIRQRTEALEQIASFLGIDTADEVEEEGREQYGRPYTLEEAETLQRLRAAEVDPIWLGDVGDSVTRLFPNPHGAIRLPKQVVDMLTERFSHEVKWVNDHLDLTQPIEIHRGPPLAPVSWGSDHYSLAATLAVQGRPHSGAPISRGSDG
ncbi:MAG: hypothetical protein GEU79_15015 [Acidimicrobiia bacterium]|nr:hypothetical protein [Acidimicrobiia bacterium]